MSVSGGIIFPSNKAHYRALASVLKIVCPALGDIIHYESAPDGAKATRLVGLVISGKDSEFYEEMMSYLKDEDDKGAKREDDHKVPDYFVAVSSVKRPPPWENLQPDDRAAFGEVCIWVEDLSLSSIIIALKHQLNKSPNSKSRAHVTRCAEVVVATQCYKSLRSLSHGQADDATNTIWAPARMLCMTDEESKHLDRAWRDWRNTSKKLRKKLANVMPPKNRPFWSASSCFPVFSFVSSLEKINSWLGPAYPSKAQANDKLVAHLDQVMISFAQIRQRAAGNIVRGNTGSLRGCKPIKVVYPRSHKTLRILVVDDHSNSWRPIFQIVARKLSASEKIKRSVVIEFSSDFQTAMVWGDTKSQELQQRLTEYDLVLLDIYLGEQDGLKLLDQIREQSMSLPVVIWTSSLALDLPAKAQRANGYLFKKTTTISEMTTIFTKWCLEGEAKRKFSLMNPYFNDTIISLEQRKIARNAESWVMRLYATFHAQSFDIYRSFNDHSAHHISNVLNNVQHIFRNAKLNNELCFSLYVGTLLHEIGMFPFSKDESKVFGLPERGKKFVKSVRKLHALRGMVMMLVEDLWKDDFDYFKKLFRPLDKVSDDREKELLRIALFVGYHARNIDKQLKKVPDFKGLSSLHAKFYENRYVILYSNSLATEFKKRPSALHFEEVISAFTRLSEMSDEHHNDVRKAAAILRFADAMDIDFTRNPVRRFTYARERNFRDDVENFKRVVVKEVEIKGSSVNIELVAPKPDEHLVKWIAGFLPESMTDEAGIKISTYLKLEILTHPWEGTHQNAVKQLAKGLNENILEPFWSACHQEDRESFSDDNQQAAMDMMVKELEKAETPVEKRSLLKKISTATGLFVVGDLVSEYQAIIDCELTHSVNFGEIKWGVGRQGLEFLNKTPYFDPLF